MDKLNAVPNRQLPIRFLVLLVVSFFIIAGLISGIILTGQKQNSAPRANTRDACQAQSAIVWDGAACPPNTIQIDTINTEQIGGQAAGSNSGDAPQKPPALCCKPVDINIPTLTPTEAPIPPKEPTITTGIPTTLPPTNPPIPPTEPPKKQCELPKPILSIWCPAGCNTLFR